MPSSGATATVMPGVGAATSFARLYCRQNRLPEARDVLAPAIAESAEGNDFSDVVAARKPLSEISCPTIGLPNHLRGWPPVYVVCFRTWAKSSEADEAQE